MTKTEDEVVPKGLVAAINSGQCVAFLGAGFSANTGKDWPQLLNDLAQRTGDPRLIADISSLAQPGAPAADLMMCAQLIKARHGKSDRSGTTWERELSEAVKNIGSDTSRVDLLREIPFKAIITTNFDGSLEGEALTPDLYTQLLREKSRWLRDDIRNPASPVFKIHGDANGNPKINPVIFASEDYRKRVHGEKSYGNFLRSVFATHTILFLGVSFTDEYLNELRSEVTSFSWDEGREPWAYAVLNDKPRLIREQLEACDGLRILHYETEGGRSFAGFDRWLALIESETSESARLRRLLEGPDCEGDVVWVDENRHWNVRGVDILERSGRKDRVIQLETPEELNEEEHSSAPFIITEFGYERADPSQSAAFRVLRKVNRWETRPPVIVFTENNDYLRDNRRAVLRQGAWEYTTEFRELFRVIETLLGRR